jgi:hypothetical protein
VLARSGENKKTRNWILDASAAESEGQNREDELSCCGKVFADSTFPMNARRGNQFERQPLLLGEREALAKSKSIGKKKEKTLKKLFYPFKCSKWRETSGR